MLGIYDISVKVNFLTAWSFNLIFFFTIQVEMCMLTDTFFKLKELKLC